MTLFCAVWGERPGKGLGLDLIMLGALAALLCSTPLHRAAAADAAPSAASPSSPAPETPDKPPSDTATPDKSAPDVGAQQTAPASAAAPSSEAASQDTAAARNPSAAPTPSAADESASPVSTSVVVNLIRLLVQEGVLTQSKADALIRQAKDEASTAAHAKEAAEEMQQKPQNAPAETKLDMPNGGLPATMDSPAPTPMPAAGEGEASAGGAAKPPSVRVQYVPEFIKKQIADQVKQQVVQQAKDENWAAPNALPEWTKRIKITGDFRVRYEWDLFDKRNDPNLTNFAAVNSSGPIDEIGVQSGSLFAPLLNTTQDRERMRIRARLGLTADVTEDFIFGLRLATGNTTNPVSTNQTLGTTLANDNIVLDRAYLQYSPWPWLMVEAGRFEDPWFHTDLVWDSDLNFDGIAVKYNPHPKSQVSPFLTAGVFPIENTPFNFPDNSLGGVLDKQPSRDKWLYAAQAGLDWHPLPDYDLRAGVAYYYFSNIQGELSSPCGQPLSASIPCNTDNSRPGFMQQGNTVFDIRSLQITDPSKQAFQFVGLASAFKELNGTLEFDYSKYDPIHIVLDGDFVTNLAFNKSAIAAKIPPNNLNADNNFAGGNNGYQAGITVGHPKIVERGDWNVSAFYKYLESDAVVDAFTDSDFHLGGTNAKGYIFGGSYGVAHNVDLTAHWYSASEISGPPYTVDVIFLDLNGRF